MILYTVLTQLDNDRAVIERCSTFKRFIIVIENGVSGNNKHYNIVYELFKTNETDERYKNFYKNSSKFWRYVYPKSYLDSLTTLKYLTKTKCCSSYENIIGGYLLKETNYKILKNEGFNVDECIKKAEFNLSLTEKRCSDLYDFIETKIMPYQDQQRPYCADYLASLAFKDLFRNKDLDALRFSKLYPARLIRNVLRSLLNEDIDYFGDIKI